MKSYRSSIKGDTFFSPAEAFIQVRIYVFFKYNLTFEIWKEPQSQHSSSGLEGWEFLCEDTHTEQAVKNCHFNFLMLHNLKKNWIIYKKKNIFLDKKKKVTYITTEHKTSPQHQLLLGLFSWVSDFQWPDWTFDRQINVKSITLTTLDPHHGSMSNRSLWQPNFIVLLGQLLTPAFTSDTLRL